MKLKQSRERKNSCNRYCKDHKLWYKEECIICSAERIKRKIAALEVF